MSTSDWVHVQDGAEWDHEAPEGSAEEDDKLKEYWAKKERRRSSVLKEFVGDSLGLKDNQRICMYLSKLGESCDKISTAHAPWLRTGVMLLNVKICQSLSQLE